MSVRPPRWLRSARQRPAAFSTLVVLSAFAVVVSALTPMLLAAVQAVTLRDRIAALAAPDDGILVTAEASTGDAQYAAGAVVQLALASIGPAGLFAQQREITDTEATYQWRDVEHGTPSRTSPLAFATDFCVDLRLVSGRCPKTTDEVAVPASVATRDGYVLGATVTITQKPQLELTGKVVAIYDDTTRDGRLVADDRVISGSTLPHPTANLLLGAGRLSAVPFAIQVLGSRQIARPVTPADVPELRSALAAARLAVVGEDGATSAAKVVTGLTDVLDGFEDQQAAAVTLSTPIALEALGLAWFALAFVSQRTARARAVEWGIGRTRGLRRRPWLAGVFVEPVVAIVLGAALGYPVALLVAATAGRAVLGSVVAIDPLAPVPLIAAGLALAGSLVALVVASSRSIRLPLDALLRETTEPRRLTRIALVAQIGVVLVTAVVLWTVLTSTGGTASPVALVLPTVVALTTGIAAMRITVVLVRRGVRKRPRSLTGLVVGRGLARAPSVLAAAVLVVVGSSLAAYTLELDAVALRAATARADLGVGAASVLHVTTDAGVPLLDAVRKADPTGRVAMAVVEADGSGVTGVNRVVAVDTTRLDAVSSWRTAWQGGVDLSRLRVTGTKDLVLRGTSLSMTVARLRNGYENTRPSSGYVELRATVQTAAGWATSTFGALRNGVLTTSIPCADGCRLVSFDAHVAGPSSPGAWGVQWDVTALSTDAQPADELAPRLRQRFWRNRIADETAPSVPARLFATDALQGALHLDAEDDVGALVADIEPASGPEVLPAVLATRTAAGSTAFSGRPGVVFAADLSRAPLLVRTVGTAPALPRALGDGVLVDLGALGRYADPGLSVGSQEVWVAPGPHPGLASALTQQGVHVGTTEVASAARTLAERSSVPRAVGLARVTAVGAVVFTLVALISAWVIDAPARRHDRRALALAGIPPHRLRRLSLLRFGLPTAAAVLLGVPAGMLAFALGVDRLPLLAGESAGPPLDTTPPALLLGGLAVVLVVLVGLITAVGARAESRGGVR